MKKQKGFTLIELLVVIAIIGLLSTMEVVSLNSARGKARDAKRVSDVKQISNLIEMAAANTGSGSYQGILPAACDGTTYGVLLSACTGASSFESVDLATVADPSGANGCTTLDGTTPVLSPCGYSSTVDNSTATGSNDYEICFYLEEGAGSVPAGLNNVSVGGVITVGCSI